MNKSTKTNPLNYFKHFLQEEAFKSYEKSFFDFPINPTFKSNREEGYIQYLKESYKDNENPYVKLYFIEELEKHLTIQSKNSLKLIIDRKDEIENTEKNANIYINRQLTTIDEIQNSIKYFEIYQPVIFSVLERLYSKLQGYLDDNQKAAKRFKANKYSSGKSFFDLKDEIKVRHLSKLYDLTLELDIIDDEVINEQDFIEIFTCPKLPKENLKLIFNKDNRTVGFYLNIISDLFNNLTPRAIHKSKSFYNKRGKFFYENDINKVNNFLRKNNIEKYNYIKEEIRKIFPN